MLTFKYVARDATSGKKVTADIQADNEQAAAKLIRQQGLAPLSIEAKSSGASGLGKITDRIKTKDKVIFSRQLSTLISAGLPLLQSLQNVGRQTQNKQLKFIISQVSSDIEGGTSFSGAIARHPDVFDKIYINLVEAGEVSGSLDHSLERLADQQEKDADIVSKVRGALAYPLIVLLVMLGVVVFMLIAVLPQVESLYEGLSGAGELPIFTRILLAVSNFITAYWYFVLIALGILGFISSRWVKTLGGRVYIDKAKMRMPLVGPLFMKLYMARFARTATTMVSSGVQLIKTLEVVAGSINNVHIERSITRAIEKVKGGSSISDAITGDENFLPLVPDMLRIGEDSGQLETMLEKTADYYEKEVDNQIKTISTIIEPMMMVLLGVMALVIIAAILLPIYGLAGQNFF
jgi:type IV pilus assembly protein PilC